jgi:hypothetical protein
MRVFTKINGKIAVWEVSDMTYEQAISAVRGELGTAHKPAILALVKY